MKHIYLFIGATIITYLLISLATLDLMWYVHKAPWIWIAVIPLYVFLSFILFLIFGIEKTGNEENQYVTRDEARKIAEDVCKEMFNIKENKYDK